MGKCINYDIPRRRREEFLVCRQREEGKGGGGGVTQFNEEDGDLLVEVLYMAN
jgi:hypothetical protein